MSENERLLLKSARKGSLAVFEELIEPHQIRVYNLFFKTCCNEFEASQLTQEVFIRVFRSFELEKDEALLTFNIYKTAGEVCQRVICNSKKIS